MSHPVDNKTVQELLEALEASGYTGPAQAIPLPPLDPFRKQWEELQRREREIEALEREEKKLLANNDDRYPHECPKCKGPAYIGFNKFECKAKCT